MKLMRFPNRTALWNDTNSVFDSLFEQSLAPFEQLLAGRTEGARQMAADVLEDEHNFTIRVELPGVKREDINVQLENRALDITVEQTGGDDTASVKLARRFQIAHPVAADKISAKLDLGILSVTLPKSEEAKARTIQID